MKKYANLEILDFDYDPVAVLSEPDSLKRPEEQLLTIDEGRLVYGNVLRVDRMDDQGEWAHGVVDA